MGTSTTERPSSCVRLRECPRRLHPPVVEEREREQLRRLAVWVASRRDVDDALAGLTRYGPSANAQVAAHMSALRHLVVIEANAFSAVEAGADTLPQRPLPMSTPLRATVHSLQSARERRSDL